MANLTADDAPIVAKAIVSCLRKQGYIGTVQVENVAMVRMYGQGFDVYVRGEDWLKLGVFFIDGTLNTLTTTFPIIQGDPPLDPSTIDLQDPTLYQLVEGLLVSLFPKRFPRSKI